MARIRKATSLANELAGGIPAGSTRWPAQWLNDAIPDGCPPGTLCVFGADSHAGKSYWALQHAVDAGIPACYISLEDGDALVAKRLRSIGGDQRHLSVFVPDDTSVTTILEALDELGKRGCKVVYLDYVQLLEGRPGHSRTRELASMVAEIRASVLRHGMSVWFLSQVTLPPDLKGPPTKRHLRDCKDLGIKADVVVMAYRDRAGVLHCILDKDKLNAAAGAEGNYRWERGRLKELSLDERIENDL